MSLPQNWRYSLLQGLVSPLASLPSASLHNRTPAYLPARTCTPCVLSCLVVAHSHTQTLHAHFTWHRPLRPPSCCAYARKDSTLPFSSSSPSVKDSFPQKLQLTKVSSFWRSPMIRLHTCHPQ